MCFSYWHAFSKDELCHEFTTPLAVIRIVRYTPEVPVVVDNKNFFDDLIIIFILDFIVILGMDCLSCHDASINCK